MGIKTRKDKADDDYSAAFQQKPQGAILQYLSHMQREIVNRISRLSSLKCFVVKQGVQITEAPLAQENLLSPDMTHTWEKVSEFSKAFFLFTARVFFLMQTVHHVI